ncbi:Protein of unknown function DUF4246 [Penicillium concentricum]|uniref:DUF4246 domain-containing protein n=1 Tax=Penicillium concentricum TaxID=293559 RepID=A0A9W9RS51_9EURO|nr:Protein of unknown function DUF4246 [Penicillium concentricum]KAJ5365418.1 Protein of unknown function DUF4246 [Penicillium concentricum]
MFPGRVRRRLPDQRWTKDIWDAYCVRLKEYLTLPELDQKYRVDDPDPTESEDPDDFLAAMTPEMWEMPPSMFSGESPSEEEISELVGGKSLRLHTFKYPEAGISYSYEDWKQGKTIKSFIEKRKDYSRSPPSEHQYQSISLQDEFRKDGLQVIVRISSIDLTPENPCYQGDDDFHVDGLLNEHIVATSRYYYDVENITEAYISFQQEDELDPYECRIGMDAMHKIFGLPVIKNSEGFTLWTPRLQTLGSVVTYQGRFLAWANSLRHKNKSFSLEDATRPGHQRYITLFLVDPHYRICSTRNVPPQQHEWWRESVLANVDSLNRLPQELADLIMDETKDWPVGVMEAEKWKHESDAERERAREVQIRAVDYSDFEVLSFSARKTL